MTDASPTMVITIISSATSNTGRRLDTCLELPKWSTPDSQFSAVLKSRLAEEGLVCTVHYFYWSGRNTVWARRRAARDLAGQIYRLLETHPGATHFLIGEQRGAVICRGILLAAGLDLQRCAATMASRSLSVASVRSSWKKKLGYFALALFVAGIPILDFCAAGFDELFGSETSEVLGLASTLGVLFLIAHWLANESDRNRLLLEVSGKDELDSSLLVVRVAPEFAPNEVWPHAFAEVLARFVTRLGSPNQRDGHVLPRSNALGNPSWASMKVGDDRGDSSAGDA